MNDQTIEMSAEMLPLNSEVSDEVLEAAGGPMAGAFTFLTMSCDYACHRF
jgi:hypothetical protein